MPRLEPWQFRAYRRAYQEYVCSCDGAGVPLGLDFASFAEILVLYDRYRSEEKHKSDERRLAEIGRVPDPKNCWTCGRRAELCQCDTQAVTR